MMNPSHIKICTVLILLSAVCSEIIQTDQGSQDKNNVHLLDHQGIKLSSSSISVDNQKLSDVRDQLTSQFGDESFVFLRPISKQEQNSVLAETILNGDVIIVMRNVFTDDQQQQNIQKQETNVSDMVSQTVDESQINMTKLADMNITETVQENTITQIFPNIPTKLGGKPVINENNQENQENKTSSEKPEVLQAKFQTKRYRNGDYEGWIINGRRSGYGTFKFNQGDIYTGYWSNDVFNGQGQYIDSKSGNVVNGTFKDGELVGEVTLRTSGGEVYTGKLASGMPHGTGQLRTKNFIYTGDFKNGAMHGSGIMEFIDGPQKGTIVQGNYTNGQLDGDVLITLPNGTKRNAKYSMGTPL